MNDRDDFVVWTEKYRPKTFEDVIGQSLIINKIKQNVAVRNITNWIFKGKSGTGKTTTAYVVAYSLYGRGNLIGNFNEINASDKNNRGIDVVNKKIIPFARTAPLSISSPFRLLLLEEADNLTDDMMEALRRPMEKYINNCRFILTVNNVKKISKAIRSRCVEFEFSEIDNNALISYLQYISTMENLRFTAKQFNDIANFVSGDMRRGIEILQNMQVNQDDYNAVFGR